MFGEFSFPLAALVLAGILGGPVHGLFEGDSCTVRRSGSAGVCRFLTDCPQIAASIRRKPPTICGFSGLQSIVCCPDPVSAPVTGRPPTPTPLAGPDNRIDERRPIGVQKCRAYQAAVNQTQRFYTVGGGFVDSPVQVCTMDATPFIVNGVETQHWEFPHMAVLVYGNNLNVLCGGSLISENYVLTAAHCIRTKFGSPTVVRLGVHSMAGDDTGEANRSQSFAVADTHVHPDYNRTLSSYNDIGLIRLQQPVTLSPYIRPACLPEADTAEEQRLRAAVACGWGHTESGGESSDRLQKVRLDLYSAAECNETYTQPRLSKLARGVDPQTQMCAGSRREHKDSCQGDSGGPLQIQHEDAGVYCMYQVLGVVSVGRGCGAINTPSIYTRVAGFVPWIERMVWPDG